MNNSTSKNSRPDGSSGRHFKLTSAISPLDDPDKIRQWLDQRAELAKSDRIEKLNVFNLSLRFVFMTCGALAVIGGFVFSICVVANNAPNKYELAKWILETLASGFVASVIGVWAVKSFEEAGR